MFCPNCGKQIPEGSAKCPQCGEVLREITRADGGAIMGFFLLLASFFTMPLKTLKITAVQLREIGGKGKLKVEATEVPHLTWLGVAGHLLASIAVILIVVIGVIRGLSSLKHLKYSASDAIGGLLINSIGGAFIAIFADWVIMISLELLLLWVSIANDIKKIGHKE
ncbi:MAG: zinc ribbon domain-containing protein [bacterium]